MPTFCTRSHTWMIASVVLLFFSSRARAEETRPILGVFYSGDLREKSRDWGAKWYLTDSLEWVFLFENKTYRWAGQSRPDDNRFEIDLPRQLDENQDPTNALELGDIKKRSTSSSRLVSNRRSVAATLQGIASWYKPQATQPFYLANYLFRAGFADTPLNEVWLKTEKGTLYFVGKSIYLWTRKKHGQNPLVATVGLDGLPDLLAYASLNPTPLPHLLVGYGGFVGSIGERNTRVKSVYSFSADGSAKLELSNLPIPKRGDRLDKVVAEVNSPRFYSGLGYVVFENETGQDSVRPAGFVPQFLSTFEGKPLLIQPLGVNIRANFFTSPGAKLSAYPNDVKFVFEHQAAGLRNLEVQIGGIKWLAAVIEVKKNVRQTSPGRILNTYGEQNNISFAYATTNTVLTSGWTVPIKKLDVQGYSCSRTKKLVLSPPNSLAGQSTLWHHQSSFSGDSFECSMSTTPPPKAMVNNVVKVTLDDGTSFTTSATANLHAYNANVPSPLYGGLNQNNCATTCELFGGVWPLSDLEEEKQCRALYERDFSYLKDRVPYSANKQSGGHGCTWGKLAPNPNFQGFEAPSFAGPANRSAKVGRRVCFCRLSRNQNFGFSRPNLDFVPHFVLE